MRGDSTTSAVTASDHWEVGRSGEVYGPAYHRMMDTGTGSSHFGRFSPAVSSGPYDSWTRTWVRFVAAPHWLVALVAALLPLASALLRWRGRERRRRAAQGRCLACGYDSAPRRMGSGRCWTGARSAAQARAGLTVAR